MPHFLSIAESSVKASWLTVGVFDGVHLGHQVIMRRLMEGAHAAGLPACVVTFHPHPAAVLGRRENALLTLPDERAEILQNLGIDVVITETFTQELASWSALTFMEYLKKHLGLQHLLVGHDFALGKGREGDVPRLTEIGQQLGYTLETVPALRQDDVVISSTAIRDLIRKGQVDKAAEWLGRPYSLRGEVIRGDGRGKQIGVPTANLKYATEKLPPARGIYAGWALVGGERYQAAISIGFNPTFTPERQVASVEAYLLDFDEDIYGEELRLDFIDHLRDEAKFESVEALVEQIWRDVNQTRALLEA